jgi:hypothetical protein
MLAMTIVALALGAATPAATPSPARTPAKYSRAQAEALRLKLLAFEERMKKHARGAAQPKATVVVTQEELNSYINLSLQPQLLAGLRDVEFGLDGGRIKAHAMVDLDQVNARLGKTTTLNPLAFLSGMVTIEIAGRLKTTKGFGTFEINDVRVGPMLVPPALLARAIASSTRTKQNPEGFDVLAPFRLPYGLTNVRTQTDRLTLDF